MQRIAGTLGYQGDMSGFNDYLNQNPDKKQQMDMYQNKAVQMLQGGLVKMQQGGSVTPPQTPQYSGESITELQAQRALDPALAYGATVEPVGTEVTQEQVIQPTSGQVVGDITTPITTTTTAQAAIAAAEAAAAEGETP